MSWLPVTRALPVLPDREYGYPRSEQVMVYQKSGGQCVARFVRLDDDDPSSSGRWISSCSEGWDITDSVTYWRPCFEAPTDRLPREPVSGFFVEREQLDRLRLISKGVYGDGTALTPDNRRDLANCLVTLIAQLADQPVAV